MGPKPCGLTFRQRLLSVRLDRDGWETASRHNDYDAEAIEHSFGVDTLERELDATDGLGHSWSGKGGSVWHRNRKTKEPEQLTSAEIDKIYLNGRGEEEG